jgi:valyl-tRNA synthetase
MHANIHCTGLPEAELASLAVTAPMTAAELSQLPLPERHIVSKCHQLVAKVTAGLESYDMGDTGRLIYEFLWDEYADWYIEASKVSVCRCSFTVALTHAYVRQ